MVQAQRKKLTKDQAVRAAKYLRELHNENDRRSKKMDDDQMRDKARSAARSGKLNKSGEYIKDAA